MSKSTVAVVGSGVMGAGIAWRAAEAGFAVTLIDPKPGSGASWVAGGMLAPTAEAWPGEEDLFALGLAGLARWPDFAAELRDRGHDPGLRTEGTVLLGADTADRDELDTVRRFLDTAGHPVEPLTGRELRRLEPAIGPLVRGGFALPEDLAVDNRRLLEALFLVARAAGVRGEAVAARSVRSGAVELVNGSVRHADVVVLAAGAWSGTLHPALGAACRPVKGEILRLRARPGSLPPPTRTVRGIVEGRHGYLVPRDNGGLVLGATQYEAGFDAEPRVAGVRDLLADAERLIPAIADYALVEAGAGLRPGTSDNLPVIGWLEPGLLAATGHGRNGMLLAPITVDAVTALLDGKPVPEPVGVATPARLERGAR